MCVGSRLDVVTACFRLMEHALQNKGHIVCVLDPTLPQSVHEQQVRTCKMSALAWCYRDGGVYMKHKKLSAEEQEKNVNKLSQDQEERMVIETPSFLEVTSYIFFCSTAGLGMFFEFSDYKRWIE